MPMAAPTRKPTGLAAILQGIGGLFGGGQGLAGQPMDGTRLRRGLGDALMGVGAIGLGQDPMRALATVRQQRFQQERAQTEDQQRIEDIQREQQETTEERQIRAQEIAGKYAYEDRVRGEENKREDVQRSEDRQFELADQAEQTRRWNAQFGLQSQAQARADAEAAAKKEKEAKRDRVLLSLADELGLAPMTTALLKSGDPELIGQAIDQAETQMGMGGDSEKEREIAGLMARGFDRAQAEDIAYDRIGFMSDPQYGGIYTTNKGMGTATPIQGTLPGQGEPAPPIAPQQSNRPPLAQDLERATGAMSNVEDIINRTVGQVVPGTPFPETADARQRVQLVERTLQEALVNNPRFPVAEQQHVRSMIPSAGEWFQDPDTSIQRINNLIGYLQQKQAANAQTLNSAVISKDERARLMDQNASINRVMSMINNGPESGGQDTSVRKVVRDPNTGEFVLQ